MVALLMIVGVAGAIWLAVAVLRVPPLLLAILTVLVGATFGAAFLTFSFGGIRLTLDRLLLPVLLVAFFAQRQQGVFARRPLETIDWLILATLGWFTISMAVNDYRMAFGHSATPWWRWLTGYCIPVALYWIAKQSLSGERTLSWLQAILLLFGIYLALTGLFEIMRMWSLVFPKHIADARIPLHFGRARGPMVSAVSYGLYLGTSLLCLWAVRDRLGKAAWFVVPPVTALFAAGLYYSYTRSSWIGVFVGVVIILGVSMRGRGRAFALGGLVVGAAILLAANLEKVLFLQREQSGAVAKGSAECRLSFAYVSWKMFLDSPIWGVGFGQFPSAKLDYLSNRVDLPLQQIRPLVHHNTYLSVLTETGLVGLGLFLAVLYCWAREAWRLCRRPDAPPWLRRQAVWLLGALGLFACQMAFHELSYSTIDNSLLFLLAGGTLGARAAWEAGSFSVAAMAEHERSASPRPSAFDPRVLAPR